MKYFGKQSLTASELLHMSVDVILMNSLFSTEDLKTCPAALVDSAFVLVCKWLATTVSTSPDIRERYHVRNK